MSQGLNTVNVFSIDAERLRFRIIVAIDTATAAYDAQGRYDVDIPIPTSFANSHEYSSARISCDSFTALISAAAAAVNQVWSDRAGNFLRSGSIELGLSAPSSQSSVTAINTALGAAPNPGSSNEPIVFTGGYRQLIPMQFTTVGGIGAGWVPGAAINGGWMGIGSVKPSAPILAANPFGQRLTISFTDPFSRANCFLANAAAAPGVDLGKYAMEFEVELVADK